MRASRVLVVDDEPALRMTLAANLELSGFEAVAAASGEEALALATAQPFDLVVTDIRMPGLSGIELFRRLRAASLSTPVVLMTGFAVEEQVQRALEDGTFAVLSKPFDVERALKLLARAARTPLVLVVDDAKTTARSLETSLAEVGLRAQAATTADDAVRVLQEGNVDVCVVDMVMPDASGPEVMARLKAIEPAAVMIGMSGNDVPELVRKSASLGMHTFLRKPFRIQDLIRSIAHARGAAQVG